MVSKTPDYGNGYTDAKPGNLVMDNTIDLSHPAFTMGLIGHIYVLFRCVVGFVYLDWHTGTCDDEWDSIVQAHRRIQVRCSDVANTSNHTWNTTPTVTHVVKVVGKNVDGELKEMNSFIVTYIKKHFFHYKP